MADERERIRSLDDEALRLYADEAHLDMARAQANWQVATAEIERRRVGRAWEAAGDGPLWCRGSSDTPHLVTREAYMQAGYPRGKAICGTEPYGRGWIVVDESRQFHGSDRCKRCLAKAAS